VVRALLVVSPRVLARRFEAPSRGSAAAELLRKERLFISSSL
jgi:hypothetical protein